MVQRKAKGSFTTSIAPLTSTQLRLYDTVSESGIHFTQPSVHQLQDSADGGEALGRKYQMENVCTDPLFSLAFLAKG